MENIESMNMMECIAQQIGKTFHQFAINLAERTNISQNEILDMWFEVSGMRISNDGNTTTASIPTDIVLNKTCEKNLCKYVLKSGTNKGKTCQSKAVKDNYCNKHKLRDDENDKCAHMFKTGTNKGTNCRSKAVQGDYCNKHKPKNGEVDKSRKSVTKSKNVTENNINDEDSVSHRSVDVNASSDEHNSDDE